jgi:8-oxo-dGTP pyrophosphatase MutT (NUDIX family)
MRAYSAGGVVFRLVSVRSTEHYPGHPGHLATPLPGWEKYVPAGHPSVEVALVGRSHSGIWTLPKGTPQAGETVEQVALREVQEETGLVVRLISYIGSISYSFVRDQIRYQKQVRHFLLEAIGGDISLHDAEYDRVEWFPMAEACRRLTYQNEVNILYHADDILQRWLEDQRKEGLK